MHSTKSQRQYIYKLCSYQKGLKEECVQWATNDNKKTSTTDLTFNQANAIIKQMGGTPERANANTWGRFNKDNQQHIKILSLCQKYGWQTRNPKTGYTVADITKLGNWLQTDPRCPVNKPLKKMTPQECTTIINALTIMVGKKYK